jgi:GxxExxY protein
VEPADRIDALARAVVDAAFQVHTTLGPGFLESVYRDALAVELTLRRIPFGREVPIAVSYKGHGVGRGFLDLLVDQQLVVELKAVEALAPIHTAQVISYLKATRLPLGLLITFNVREIRRGIRRVVLTQQFRNDASDGTLNPLGALGGLAVGQENRPSRV